MSWSVSACGPTSKVAEQLEQQFERVNMNDIAQFRKGEQETVQHVRRLVAQVLATIEPEKIMRVSASGSMGFKDWQNKTGAYQSVDLKIEPIHFS
jgi:hypothetical protein